LIWSPFALALLALPISPHHREKIGRSIIRTGFSFYLTVLRKFGWLHLAIENWEFERTAPPSIIAPNHPSLLDAVILLSELPDCTCILKSSLLNHPLFGPGARLAGYIPNDRTHEMIRKAVKALNAGQHVLMFPEGTRTLRQPISPLKVSPFLIAWRAHAPVQTILIQNAAGFLGKNTPCLKPPNLPISISVRPGKVFTPKKNVRHMAKTVEDYFMDAL
jgi:1-acyl-sn-glycerol-3-phosphate acyltransferase